VVHEINVRAGSPQPCGLAENSPQPSLAPEWCRPETGMADEFRILLGERFEDEEVDTP
jgi:hypothetical protein